MSEEQGGVRQSPELDWSWVDDVARRRFVDSIDDDAAMQSSSLQGITRLAATVTGMRCAQVSLIGGNQFVPASFGCTYGDEQQHTPVSDSLCSVTMAYGDTLGIQDARNHAWVRDLSPVRSDAVGSYLGVPLRDPEGRPIGALCAFDKDASAGEPTGRQALEDLAGLVTRELHLLAALETRAANEIRLRRAVTEIVDRPTLVDAADLVARARYLMPADAPGGGDWIDLTDLGDGRAAMSIGDVVGHGLPAVAVMDEIRHALRAYTLDAADPAEALHLADRLLARLRPDTYATALHGVYDARSQRLQLASAGHPPPVLLHDGRATFVDVAPIPPLGFDGPLPRMTSVPFGSGDRLVLVTDGVFERRNESVDVGLERLRAQVEAMGTSHPPDDAADQILAELVGRHSADDACILVIDNRTAPALP